MTAIVRPLGVDDAEDYVRLRRAMLLEAPFAFLSSPDDDIGSHTSKVRDSLAGGDGSAVFGAYASALVGAIGLYRERHAKSAHKAHIWGMYVAPAHRRLGIGRRLLTAAIDHARTLAGVSQILLGVSEMAPAARALYESVGFRTWGTERRAIAHDGRFADEHHMVLMLDTEGPGT